MRNKTSTLRGQISTQRAIDRQSGGNHYKNLKYQVSEFILGNNLNWIDGNIVKYAVRNKKGESLKNKYEKIKHYCDLGIELIEE